MLRKTTTAAHRRTALSTKFRFGSSRCATNARDHRDVAACCGALELAHDNKTQNVFDFDLICVIIFISRRN